MYELQFPKVIEGNTFSGCQNNFMNDNNGGLISVIALFMHVTHETKTHSWHHPHQKSSCI